MIYLKYDLYVRRENGKWVLGLINFTGTNELDGFEDVDDIADTIVGLVNDLSFDSIKKLLVVNLRELDK